MDAVHQGVVRLHAQRHLPAVALPGEFPPGEARHRVDRLQVDGVHEAGEGNPGDGGHEQQVILPGLVLQAGVFFHVGKAPGGFGGKGGEIGRVGHGAEAEQVILRQDGGGGVDDFMLHHLLAADAPAELGQLIRHPGYEIDNGDRGGDAASLDDGKEGAQIHVGAQAEVRIAEGRVQLELLGSRPGGQVEGVHVVLQFILLKIR